MLIEFLTLPPVQMNGMTIKIPVAFCAISLLLIVNSCRDYGLKVKKIDDDFYLILGEGGNSGVLFSDSNVIVIDTKVKTGAERMRRWVQRSRVGASNWVKPG